jgi:hypothetical protein
VVGNTCDVQQVIGNTCDGAAGSRQYV